MQHPNTNRGSHCTGPHRGVPGFALALLALLAFPACQKKSGPEGNLEIKVHGDRVTVPTDAPQTASLAVEVAKPAEKSSAHLTGRLVWDEETSVRVFPSVAGRVNEIRVRAGQHVAAGETLATMFSVDFGQAQADASKAEADLKLSERTLTRLRDLYAHGAAAQKDVEAAEDDFENKKAERSRAVARLKLYGVEAGTVDGMFPLKAPLSGVVVEKNINPGQEVRADAQLANDPRLFAPLFTLSNPSRLSVLLDATELDIAALRPGQPLQIHTRAFPDRIFVGQLAYIGDSLDPMTRTVKARGIVENPDGLLKAEMFVSVDIAIDGADRAAEPAVTAVSRDGPASAYAQAAPVEIPAKAVFLKDNQHFVFIEKAPGEYARQSVEVGSEQNGRVRVTDGLIAGQRVVTEGSLLLQAVSESGKE